MCARVCVCACVCVCVRVCVCEEFSMYVERNIHTCAYNSIQYDAERDCLVCVNTHRKLMEANRNGHGTSTNS